MWQDLTLNSKSIYSIFGDEEPSLKKALLKKVDLSNNGPEIVLYLEIVNFPLTPPKKWIEKGYNTAQIWMRLIDVTHVKLTGWGRYNVVDIQLKKIEDDLIYLNAKGAGCDIEMTFKWIDAGVTGYKKIIN